jgi:hypothetical protein
VAGSAAGFAASPAGCAAIGEAATEAIKSDAAARRIIILSQEGLRTDNGRAR